MSEIPTQDRPLSEQFRLAAKAWVEADAAANLLEELKTTTLEQKKQSLIEREGDMPDSHAERRIKSDPEWETYIQDMVAARKAANLAKVRLEWLRMKEREADREEWHQRTERKMGRTAT
jgi:hypothetical protein